MGMALLHGDSPPAGKTGMGMPFLQEIVWRRVSVGRAGSGMPGLRRKLPTPNALAGKTGMGMPLLQEIVWRLS
jgi:hypothetical protein